MKGVMSEEVSVVKGECRDMSLVRKIGEENMMLSQENESLKDKIKEMKTERKIMAIRHTRVED
jgi:regulator of replication initiation timing